MLARYRERGVELYVRADAAFAKPELYETLEAEGVQYAIRLPANRVLMGRIGHLLTRPVGRPPKKPQVFHAGFSYQAQSWSRPRRVVAKVEWHQGELYPRVGWNRGESYAPKGEEQHRRQPKSGHGLGIRWSSPAKTCLDTPPTTLRRLRFAPERRKLGLGHAAFGKCRFASLDKTGTTLGDRARGNDEEDWPWSLRRGFLRSAPAWRRVWRPRPLRPDRGATSRSP